VVFLENKRTCIIPIHKPSLNEQIFFFISGIIFSVPFVVFFSQFSDALCVNLPFINTTICTAVLFAPFLEEFAKVVPLFYRHGETERSLVTLGMLIGLGFGVTEMILYVSLLGVPFVDRIPGLIFHASSATIISYGLAKRKIAPYYLVAVALHLLNNLLAVLLVPVISLIGAVLIVSATFLLSYKFYFKASPEKTVANT
jgi:hypothetical protein